VEEKAVESKAAEKRRAMWIILGIVAALIGVGLWMAGRSKDPRFSAAALRRRFFGGPGQG
jgi:hypothetical protein